MLILPIGSVRYCELKLPFRFHFSGPLFWLLGLPHRSICFVLSVCSKKPFFPTFEVTLVTAIHFGFILAGFIHCLSLQLVKKTSFSGLDCFKGLSEGMEMLNFWHRSHTHMYYPMLSLFVVAGSFKIEKCVQ